MVIGLCLCAVGVAQEQGPPAAEAEEQLPPEIIQDVEMLMQMGMEREQATLLSAMMSDEIDPTKLMMLYMLMGQGRHGGGAEMAMLPWLTFMGRGGASKDIPCFKEGKWLYVIDGGVLYKINLETMKVDTTLKYSAKTGGANIMRLFLAPMIGKAREKALTASCLSNVKQLALGLLLYAQDHDEALPGEEWAEELRLYIKPEGIYRCPSRPQTPVGYALNDLLLGAELASIARPAEAIALFETDLGGDSPVGSAADIPDQGFHNGGVVVGYVDGHARWITVAEARRQLAIDPFQ